MEEKKGTKYFATVVDKDGKWKAQQIPASDFKANWDKVVINDDDSVDITGLTVMRMGKTFYKGQHIDPNYLFPTVNHYDTYKVEKRAEDFYKDEVVKAWDGVPLASTNGWPCPKPNDVEVTGGTKRHKIVGVVKNPRVVENTLVVDLHIDRPNSYLHAFVTSEKNMIAAAYHCRYVMVDGDKAAFFQDNIKPSHFFMCTGGLHGMNFILPPLPKGHDFKVESYADSVIGTDNKDSSCDVEMMSVGECNIEEAPKPETPEEKEQMPDVKAEETPKAED